MLRIRNYINHQNFRKSLKVKIFVLGGEKNKFGIFERNI